MKLLQRKGLIVTLALAAGSAGFLRWGLQPTAGLFYGAYHLLGWDWLYRVYGPLKGVADYTAWWPGYWMVCLAVPGCLLVIGIGITVLRMRRSDMLLEEA